MRCLIVTYGSRGDMQPFVALAKALLITKHEVTICSLDDVIDITKEIMASAVTDPSLLACLNYVELEGISMECLASIWKAVQAGDPLAVWKGLGVYMKECCIRHAEILAQHSQTADVLITSYLGRPFMYVIGEMLRKPAILVQLQPQVPTAQFPHHAHLSWLENVVPSTFSVSPPPPPTPTPATNTPSSLLSPASLSATAFASYERIESVTWNEYIDSLNDFRRSMAMRMVKRDELSSDNDINGNGSLQGTELPDSCFSSFERFMQTNCGNGPFKIINAFSPELVHPPSDWGSFVDTTGFFNVGADHDRWEPPAGLLDFFQKCEECSKSSEFSEEASKKPVYMGFGSMLGPSRQWSLLALRTLRSLNTRAILLRGAAKIGEAALDNDAGDDDDDTKAKKGGADGEQQVDGAGDEAAAMGKRKREEEEEAEAKECEELRAWAKENVYEVESVPHEWLLPRCRLAVHHGGSGTAHQCCLAGVPSVVAPVFADQFFWGCMIQASGAGLRTRSRMSTLTSAELVSVIRLVDDDATGTFKSSALALKAQMIAGKEGAHRAVTAIEEFCSY